MAERTNPHANLIIGAQDEATPVFEKIKASSQSMAAGVEQAAKQAAKGTQQLGDEAEKSHKKIQGLSDPAVPAAQTFDRATSSMIRQVQRLNAELEAGGARNAAYLEKMASVKGVDMSALAPYLADLKKAEAAQRVATTGLDHMGMSAKQTTAALRQVPMQFTDIVVSLQGGQSAMQVFLQQGGQLKDMFGGVGAAARALGGYVLGLINPFTIAAAAVGAIAVAYKQGSAEADGYRMALVMTGNAAGTTAAQMQQMAGRISSVVGTQGAAADALAQMASSGRVASQSLEYFSEVAIKFERTTGTAISETVKRFAELGASPVDASRKLNEETNYLTASIYEQIKALKDQGREADAAALAQNTYADALNNRSAQITQNLGAIEGAWKAIKDAAKSGWDAMLNIGRSDSLETQIDNVRAKIAQAKGQDKNRPFSMPWDTSLADLEKQLSYLTEQERVIRRGAEAQAQRTQAEKDAIAASDALQKTQASGMTNQQKMNKALEEYARHIENLKATNPASVLLSPDAIARGEKAIRDQFSDKGKGSAGINAANKELAEQAKLIAELSGLTGSFAKDWDKLNDMFKRGKLDVDGLTQAQATLLAKQPVIAAETKAQADAQKQVNASIDAYRSALQAVAKEEATRVDGIAKSNADLREQIATMGLTNQQIRARTIELNRATIAEKERQLARLQTGYTNTREQAALEEEIRLLKERNGLLSDQGVKEQYVAAQQEMAGMWQSIDSTAHDVFVNIFEDGAGTFKRLGQTLKSALLDMLYQLTVKRWIINIGASFGATGGIFGDGQGGAGSLLGTASNLNTAWGMLSGTGGNMGALTGLMSGSMSWANAMGSVYANTTGTGISGLLATNGAYGTAGGAGAGLGATAAGLAAVAAPLIIGSLIERNARDRISGAAYATSGGNDPFVNTVAGSTGFNYLTGDLPDRAALMARLEELGAPMEAISDWNDRALLRLMESAAADNSEFGINWTSRVRDMRDTPDFYRGAGYAHPEELGWWNNKDNANLSTDPALIQASRDIALAIIGPLEGIGALIGDEAAYRATVGFANRGEGNGLWAGLNLQRDGQNVADWVNTDDFHSVGEAVRAMYSTALGTLDSFDLPGWADKQVTDARAALDALEGENMGQEAAALYAQTTAGIEQMYRSIQMLIDVFPDFSAATQDSVFALQELMGGMDQLQGAYSSYLQNFWSDEERADLMRKQLGLELGAVGLSLPETRDAFRDLVEAQDLNTEAGRAAFAALMGVAGAFAQITPAAESAADAAARLAEEQRRQAEEAYSNARSRTDDVWARLQQLFNDQIDNWQKLAGEARAIFDIATDAARQLRGEVSDTRAWDAAQGRDFIAQALPGLRSTGALPDSDALSRAIESALGGLSMDGYATAAEYEFDQLVLAGQLQEIGDISGTQASFAEQQVDLLKEQMDHWRKQLELLRGMDLNITTIAEGITVLADAMRAEQAAAAAAKAAQKPSTGGGGGGSFGPQGIGREPINYATEGEMLKAQEWYGNGNWNMTIGWSLGGVSAATGISPEDLEKYLQSLGLEIANGIIVPKFDVGTNYVPRDMVAQIHEGERIIPAADNTRLMALLANANQGGQNDALVAEVKALRAEVTALRAERTAADVPMHRMAGQFANVTAGGNAMMTETA